MATTANDTAKVILIDIETTPLMVWEWSIYQSDAIEIIEDWGILCYAWKELGAEEIHTVARPDFKKHYKDDPDDDFKVVESLHELLDSADVAIAHNGLRFDFPKINSRLLVHGFEPPRPYQTVDTLKMARRHFAFASNRLNDLGVFLGLGEKEKHKGFEMWKGCMYGDAESWAEMVSYNKRDVELLEDVYYALLPWSDGLPNMALLDENPTACPRCGAEGTLTKQGFKKTKTRTYQQFKCTDCGGWSRGRVSVKTDLPLAIT